MNGNYAQALSLCQHKIDQMRAVGYGRLDYASLTNAGIIDPNPSAQPYTFATVDSLASFFPAYGGAITVEDYAAGLKRVTVQVSWQGCGTKQTEGAYTLVALIAKD